jgi:uncharacterized membrane protein YqiK
VTTPTSAIAAARTSLAAARARDLAEVIRSRAASNPHSKTLMELVAHLHTVAESFETDAPPVIDGVTVTNTIPGAAGIALMQAMLAASDTPQAGIADCLFHYVTSHITRRVPELPALTTDSPQFDHQGSALRDRIGQAVRELDTASDRHGRVAALTKLAELHSWVVLSAAAVSADEYTAQR